MKSIKSKLRTPFLLLIVTVPLMTLLLFNIATRVYVERNTENELRAVVNLMETVARRELPNSLRDFTQTNLDLAFSKLYRALRASKFSVNVEVLLFNRNQELVYPLQDSENALDEQLAQSIAGMLPELDKNEIYPLTQGGERYLVLPYPLTDLELVHPTLVFVTHMAAAASMLKFINLILIAITLAGIAVAALVVGSLSKRIAEPVAGLCELTQKIGKGEFPQPLHNRRGNGILEINMLDRNIHEMSLRLENYDKAQKTFLQNASHELKTPLMSIQGYAEGIAQGVLPDVKGAAKIIGHESLRLNKLVEELLTLSRIEGRTYTKELVSLNLCDILKEYVQRLEGLASKMERKLTLDLPGRPVNVKADDALLSQAVNNVASNCLRYAKTAVHMELAVSGGSAVIIISDDGSGIDEKDLPHLFERFYKGKGGNFGLGLAIAKSAADFMGGSIKAYNGGRGAVFEITLPLDK